MKWPKTKRTEYQGLLYIEQLVNETGNIFRKIHLEEDVGLDGVIEFVKDGESTGRLLALQVKSGDSYVVAGKDRFTVPVDVAHQIYWQSYDLPVVLVCYSPSQKLAAWEDIKQYSAPLRRVIASCRCATPLVSKWLKQRLTFSRKGRGDNSMP
jgi:uncharacterized protein DUF4365